MNKKRKGAEKMINMYDIVPRPCVDFETGTDGKIILLKPKFKNAFALKYFSPLAKQKNYQIHLDDIGTAVWKQIDGKKNAGVIAEEIEKEIGEKVKPVFERVGAFLQQLKTAKFIEF